MDTPETERGMEPDGRLPLVLFLLRVSVFILMLAWTLDKFVDPEHAAGIFEIFYFISGLSEVLVYLIGAVELAIIIGFVIGITKAFTYGAVLALHGVSTLASFPQYLSPFENLLFFAAWPALAACFALFFLRDRDTLLAVS